MLLPMCICGIQSLFQIKAAVSFFAFLFFSLSVSLSLSRWGRAHHLYHHHLLLLLLLLLLLTKRFFSSSKLCNQNAIKTGAQKQERVRLRATRASKHARKRPIRCGEHDDGWFDAPGDGGGVVRNLVRRETRVRRRIRNGKSGESPTRRDDSASRRHTVVRDDVRRRI